MRRTAVLVGVLFWISNLATLVGRVITGPIPTASTALNTMSPHATQIVVGALITQINDLAIIGYAVLLFPVLKRSANPWRSAMWHSKLWRPRCSW
jgi:hypothetical protein